MSIINFRNKNKYSADLDQRILTVQNINQIKAVVNSNYEELSGKFNDYALKLNPNFSGNIYINNHGLNTVSGLVQLNANKKIPTDLYDNTTNVVVANDSLLSGNGTSSNPLNIKYGTNVANGLVQLNQHCKIPSTLYDMPDAYGNTYYEFTSNNIGTNNILMIPNYGMPIMIKTNVSHYYPIQKTTLTEIQNANLYNLFISPYLAYQNKNQLEGTWTIYYANSVNHITGNTGILAIQIDQSLTSLIDVNIINNKVKLNNKLTGKGIVIKGDNGFELLPLSNGVLQSNGNTIHWTETTTCE